MSKIQNPAKISLKQNNPLSKTGLENSIEKQKNFLENLKEKQKEKVLKNIEENKTETKTLTKGKSSSEKKLTTANNNNNNNNNPQIVSNIIQINLNLNNQKEVKSKTDNNNYIAVNENSKEKVQDFSENISKFPKTPEIFYMSRLDYFLHNPDTCYMGYLYREHFVQSFHGLNYIQTLQDCDPEVIQKKKVVFPRKPENNGKKTLILDLDETLIHCNPSLLMPYDETIELTSVFAGISLRPHVLEFLKELSQEFEIVIFTASHSSYATKVIEILDPKKNLIDHCVFRDNCLTTDNGLHVKDLRIFLERKLTDIIIVDNSSYSFGLQIDNGVPIIPFYDNKEDDELLFLKSYLKKLANVEDVRDVNRKVFKMRMYSKAKTVEELDDFLFSF